MGWFNSDKPPPAWTVTASHTNSPVLTRSPGLPTDLHIPLNNFVAVAAPPTWAHYARCYINTHGHPGVKNPMQKKSGAACAGEAYVTQN